MSVYLLIFILILILSAAFYASYSINSNVYIKAFCKNPQKGKKVAITFDDGPHPQYTEKILNVLKKHNLKASFFCVGKHIEGNEGLFKRIVGEGHSVGNHSFSHSFFFPLYSKKRMIEDMRACEDRIRDITHQKVETFRPPFGVTNPTISKAIKEFDYQVIGWSLRSFDTCSKHQKVLNKIRKRLSPGSVILLHDSLPDSDVLLERIINLIDKQGYTIVALSDLMKSN